MTSSEGAARRTWFRLLAGCAALVGLSFTQSPGLLAADTKFDLVVDPGAFMARAAHLWDPLAAFGQLQNQAYGYLWPMGPFFWVGEAVGMPGWAVQRSWLALVLVTAFLGAALLARALGVRHDLALVLAGAAYALSPRMLTVLGPISIEAWPSAVAPWVLLPLVLGCRAGSPRRAAALSGLAVAAVGGVNAAATFAVVPLGAVWLLTRRPGVRRRRMMRWWPIFVLLGTLWWLVPLFVLGAYSPPFLDFIEAADNTTFSTTLVDALRGTSNWVPYVDPASRAGNDLLRDAALPLMSGVVLAAGIFGIAHRRTPDRVFLALGASVGLLMVTFGHLGSVEGWGAVRAHDLLDGVLAPLRNVHKFDPVVRLPLVLGLAWTVQLVTESLGAGVRDGTLDERLRLVRLRVVVGSLVVAVLAAAAPAYAGRVTPAGATFGIPGYWTQAADWLVERGDAGTALLLPGSAFADYVWGSPRDEPLQYLADGRVRWAVRNAVPLAEPGNIRALDAIEERLAQGRGSAGLAPFLSRMGVAHLVVRNDLQRRSDVPDPVLVHQALDASPGITRVRGFGPEVGGDAHLTRKGKRVLVNDGWQDRYRAVEVYAVGPQPGLASRADSAPVVVGGPEDLLDLVDLGVLDDGPAVLAADADVRQRPDQLVLTDGLRSVRRNFGRVHDGASATLERDQVARQGSRARDYLLPDADRWSTWADVEGASAVTASSSTSDASTVGVVQPGQLPFAAIDGDPGTAWRSQARTDGAAWWQVDFTLTRVIGSVRVTAGPDDREVVRVRTAGASRTVAVPAGATRIVRVDDPGSRWLRVEDASGREQHRMSLAEVSVPGVQATRSLVLPELPADWPAPDAVVLGALSDERRGCAVVDDDVRCRSGEQVEGEEELALRRHVRVPEGASYDVRVTAEVRDGDALADSVLATQPVLVTASTTGVRDPRGSVLAAADGDPRTTWTASPADDEPVLSLSWLDRRRITGLLLSVDDDTAARMPTRLVLAWPSGERRVSVGRGGVVRFPAVTTDRLTLRVVATDGATSLGFDSVPSRPPVGLTELEVVGLPYLPVALPRAPLEAACGSGPDVRVEGQLLRTAVDVPPSEAATAGRVEARVCGSAQVDLRAGDNVVVAESSALWSPRSVVLTRSGSTLPVGADRDVQPVTEAGPARTRIDVSDPGVVALHQNANRGWVTDRSDGVEAEVLDGWQQGWSVADAGALSARFAPDPVYRAGIAGGLLLLAALALGIALWRPRRSRWPVLEERRVSPWLGRVAAVVVGGLLGGWVVAAAGVLLVAVDLRWSVALRRWAPRLAAVGVLVACAAYAARPWGGVAGWAGALAWPHYLVAVSLLLVLVSVSTTRPPRRRPV